MISPATPKGSLDGLWLVADMDGTLLSTPTRVGGKHPPLTTSPCMGPLCRWLSLGGSLCVLTTAGNRLWRQVYEPLKSLLASSPSVGKLMLCGFSGSVLFISDAQGQMQEVAAYREHAASGGSSTCLAPAIHTKLDELVNVVARRIISAAASDPAYIPSLSAKYHAPFRKLAARYTAEGEEQLFRAELTPENLRTAGKYLVETNDSLLDCQRVPGATDFVAQYTCSGCASDYFEKIFTPELVAAFDAIGAHCKKQPNSAVVARKGIDKATVVRYLATHAAQHHFSLNRAIALGDNPDTVDHPMTLFPPMPFVSVSMFPERNPDDTNVIHLGGEEQGTAVLLEALMKRGERGESAEALLSVPSQFAQFVVALRDAAAAARVQSDDVPLTVPDLPDD